MKYASTIREDFAFHDAIFEFVSFCEDILVVNAKGLNVHKATPMNDQPIDMEIQLACITFRDFHVRSLEPGRAWRRDSSGNLYTDDPLIIVRDKDAEARLLAELRKGICIYSFESDGEGLYHIDACGTEPWFTAQFTFSTMQIDWDSYCGPSWYAK